MRRSAVMTATLVALSATACAPGAEPDERISADPSVTALTPLPPVDHIDELAREPMIVEADDGTLYVSGYGGGRPRLWRSTNGGASWDTVGVGSEQDGAVGNSDVDLALAPDGTLHFMTMTFDPDVFEGTGISVGSSGDGGGTWSWHALSRDRFDDRPWIDVSPDGVAHAIWNDGSGVSYAVSSDGGMTWTERPRIHPVGGSSHLAVGPDGEIAVRITPLSASGNRHDPGSDHVAVSTDGGESWTLGELPGERAWSQIFDPREGLLRWVEPLAWDADGGLHALWSEGTTLWLARSTDDGATWTPWPIAEGDEPLYFPYLVAGPRGALAATWFSGIGDALRAVVAHIQLGSDDGAPPHVTLAEPFSVPAWSEGDPPRLDTAGEYVPVAFLRDGRLAVVTTIQDPAADRWGFTFRPYRVER